MIRFQASWLMENLIDKISQFSEQPKWFFPCLWKFTALEWLSHLNDSITINVPVKSQAILFNSWFSNTNNFPDEEVMKAFNQVLISFIDINKNPFKDWVDVHFTQQQLEYLLYWREAVSDISKGPLRDSFLAIVYQVMNYWLINNKVGNSSVYSPDEILTYYYRRYISFRNHQASFEITEKKLNELDAEKCSIIVFNLVFSDEDYFEDESIFIYNAWLNGYTDLEESKKNFIEDLKPFYIELGNNNFDTYLKLSENAKNVAFCWSGTGISPTLYNRTLVEPIQKVFSSRYKYSKLVYKSIEPNNESYDYILFFY